MDEFLELIKNSIKNVPQPPLYLNDVITTYLFKLNNIELKKKKNSLSYPPEYERDVINKNLFDLLQSTKSKSFEIKKPRVLREKEIKYYSFKPGQSQKQERFIASPAPSFKIRECREEVGAKGIPRKNLIHSYLFKDVFFINFVNENLEEKTNLDKLLKTVDLNIKIQYNDSENEKGEDTYGLSFLKYRAKLYEKMNLKKAPRARLRRTPPIAFMPPEFFSVMPLREKDIPRDDNAKYYPKGISIKEEIKLYNELLVSAVLQPQYSQEIVNVENNYKKMYIGEYPYKRPEGSMVVDFYKKRLEYLRPNGPWFKADGYPKNLGVKYGLNQQPGLENNFNDYKNKINQPFKSLYKEIIKPIFEDFLKENFIDDYNRKLNSETKIKYNKATNRPIASYLGRGPEKIFAGPVWFDKIMSYADIEKENHPMLDSVIDGDEIREWQKSDKISSDYGDYLKWQKDEDDHMDYNDYLEGKNSIGESKAASGAGGGESKLGVGGKKKRKKKTRRKKKSKKKKRKTRKTRKRK